MSARYVIKNLDELADKLVSMAGGPPARSESYSAGARVAYLEAARILRATVVEDRSIEDEYRHTYKAAQDCAAWDIWNSMKKRSGDPRWQFQDRRLPPNHDGLVLP